ncbi:hypothetical protein R3P38DRAFT_1778242 [Favolaschia claudopus]|uniref:Secreted protein n=1 Tax=Favolaschia claudopus TaxID=2862362 RepID=A0AAW0A5Y6_9AGAR
MPIYMLLLYLVLGTGLRFSKSQDDRQLTIFMSLKSSPNPPHYSPLCRVELPHAPSASLTPWQNFSSFHIVNTFCFLTFVSLRKPTTMFW